MPERLEDVALSIDGARWRAWNGLEITRSLDSFATVGFGAPFEPEREGFRSTFQPFSYKPIDLRVGDELLFTGALVGVEPATDPESRTVKVSCYSRPAVLTDVSAPASAYPLELDGLSLRQIAETLAGLFALDVQMDADDGASFRRVALDPDQKIHAFLVELAQQRGLVIAETPEGALRFWRSGATTGQPVARLREGEPGVLNVAARFSPQAYFSEITGIAKTRSGRGGARYTVANPHALEGVVRPHTFKLDDTDGSDVPAAARAKLGRMFANVLAVEVELPTWRDPRGELWEPDTTVTLEAPGSMIYRPSEFVIRSATLRQDADKLTASLDLVLPGAFAGEAPEVLPWA